MELESEIKLEKETKVENLDDVATSRSFVTCGAQKKRMGVVAKAWWVWRNATK